MHQSRRDRDDDDPFPSPGGRGGRGGGGGRPADWSGSGGRRGLASRFASLGDNPFTWALPLGTVAGIRVRVHLMYAIWLAIELLIAWGQGLPSLRMTAMTLGALFVLVLLHEFGHCLACRWVRGTADDILMWPLGGLASCRPPHAWRPNLVTTLGGPLVNVALFPVFGGALLLTTGTMDTVLFNPFSPGASSSTAFIAGGWTGSVLWSFHYANAALLAFNMLVPMFPMDCGRVVQNLLWWRMGYRRSMSVAVTLGLVVASAMGLAALATQQHMLLAVAIFGGVTCWFERARLRYAPEPEPWTAGASWSGSGGGAAGLGGSIDEGEPDPERAHLAAKLRARQEQARRDAELDRILDKIRRDGMASLTKAEKKWLEADRALRTGGRGGGG